ncbi:DinB family protein [Haliscomenobacter sp.]|uniref:DinB family protein n=1 Tax=Haliscomenobacter sp. TaxID=2717303 RepID=UPI003364EEAD
MIEVSNQLLAVLNTAERLLRQIDPQLAAFRPGPEKWSAKEIIGHLIDSACNNQQKFVRSMATPHLDFVGYAQNFWVSAQHYQQADWAGLIDFWLAYNRHIAHIIRHVDPAVLTHQLFIEGVGPFELGFIMPDYVEHVKHHLRQIFPEGPFESKFSNVYNV